MRRKHQRRVLINLLVIAALALFLWAHDRYPLPTLEMEFHRAERRMLMEKSHVIWTHEHMSFYESSSMVVGVSPNFVHTYVENDPIPTLWPRAVTEPTLVILPEDMAYPSTEALYDREYAPALLAVDPPAEAETSQLTLDLSSSWGEEYVFTETADREEGGLFFFQLYPSGGSDLEDGMSIQIWSDFSGLSTFAGYGHYGEENWEWFPYTLEFFDGDGALIAAYDNPAAGGASSTN